MELKERIRKYIQKVIGIRKHLIKSGDSHINEALAWKIINEIETLLSTYNYPEPQMIRFWRRKKDKIIELLPGTSSRSHTALFNEFCEIDKLTKHYYETSI